MENANQERRRFRKDLIEKCRIAAEERGEKFEVITQAIPFTNDDVPKYLALLKRAEEQSEKSKILVRSNSKEAQNFFQVSEEYKIIMKALYRWFDSSQKSNYVFRNAVA